MFEIITSNYLLWINISIPFAIGIYFFITHQEYSLKEFAIQVALTAFVMLGMFSIAYVSQDIITTSYESGKADKFVYEEEWTELVHYTESYSCGTSKSPRTCYRNKTRQDYHPDEYYISHDFGTTYISKSQWLQSKEEFGSSQTGSSHSGQISWGDGREYTAVPNKIIPVVDTSSGINYVYAAKTNIIKSANFKDLEARYKSELVPYPAIFTDIYGNRNFTRVINAGLIDANISAKMNIQLEEFASTYGKSKEVNPIVYLTTSTDREFAYVVKGFYRDAHKNDAVLVVGVDKNGSVNWTSSFGFTKSAEFLVSNENMTDINQLVPTFTNNIMKHWKRTPMEDYKYLSADIDLPLWFEALVVLLNVIGSALIFRFMFNNRL